MVKCPLHFYTLSSSLENCTIGRSRVPLYVVLLSLFAATGGIMFGYDIGVSGGVTVMDDFLCQFFPGVLEEKIRREGLKDVRCHTINKEVESTKNNASKGLYCLFGSQQVQLFTSSLYLAAMAGTCLAAYVSRRGGRKLTIVLAAIFYDVGVALNITSGSIHHSRPFAFAMLIFGRIMLGLGVGFGNQVLVGIILIGTTDDEKLAKWRAILVLVLVCVYVSAFAWSWGPLGWLISTEIFPLACRSEGQSVSVFFNMLFTFIIAHTALSMLCTMKYAIFFFFACWAIVMGVLTYLFLPETMNMEIEIMSSIWSYHWFWKRFAPASSPAPPHAPHIQMTNTIHTSTHHHQ